MYIYLDVYTCIYAYISIYKYIFTGDDDTYINVKLIAYGGIFVSICIHIYMHIYIYIYAYISIYIHIFTGDDDTYINIKLIAYGGIFGDIIMNELYNSPVVLAQLTGGGKVTTGGMFFFVYMCVYIYM
jgi:hypothetical protein